jgi:hypothetical protein
VSKEAVVVSARTSPIATIAALARYGVVAGVAGCLAMDAVLYSRYRADGGASSFEEWEFRSVQTGFDDAPAPAKVGRLIAERAHVHVADRFAGATNNVVHWATGISWGVFASTLRLVPGVGPLKGGLVAGVSAWGTSYIVLSKLKIYKPITEYDAKTLWKDLSAHLVFGSVAGGCGVLLQGS